MFVRAFRRQDSVEFVLIGRRQTGQLLIGYDPGADPH
jgi:hypothetical protein